MLKLLLWILLILLVLSNIGRVLMISDGTYSKPKTLNIVLSELVLDAVFITWIALVLGDLP